MQSHELDLAREFPYDCERKKLADLASHFTPLRSDADTQAWLTRHAAPHNRLHTFALGLLYQMLPLYEVHGLTGSYPMHLLSAAQLRELAGAEVSSVLDVGAGLGDIAEAARSVSPEVVCTETSKRLARRLRKRGFPVVEQDLGHTPKAARGPFDLVMCLNVLDRTGHPRRLLDALIERLSPRGRLLIAVPLPLSPAVFVRGGGIPPDEGLPRRAQQFEGAALELTRELFEPAGLEVERLCRLPYFSRGDARQPLYVLDDALWVLRHRSERRHRTGLATT